MHPKEMLLNKKNKPKHTIKYGGTPPPRGRKYELQPASQGISDAFKGKTVRR